MRRRANAGGSNAENNVTPVRDAINIISLAPGANDGLLGKFASMLVRPDGYVAHVCAP